MSRGVASALIAGLLGAPIAARAQAVPDGAPAGWSAAASYQRLIDDTVKIMARQIAEIDAGRRAARASVPLRAPALATANATTAVELAQAAISTSVAGADAGVTVSPFALLGFQDSPTQVPITLAALKDGVTRFQLGVTRQGSDRRIEKLERCTLDEAAVRKRNDDLPRAYVAVCTAVAGIKPPTVNDENKTAVAYDANDNSEALVHEVRQACGLEAAQPMTLGRAAGWISHGLRELRARYAERTKVPGDAAVALPAAALEHVQQSDLDVLAAYQPLPRDSCEANAAPALEQAATEAAKEATHTRVGVSLRGDLFDHRWGFNPDPKSSPLPDGRLKDAELRVEAAYARRGFEIAGGIGYGQARAAIDSDLVGYVSPSLSLAWTVASLSGESLYDSNGRLHVVNGALPPHLVIGFDAQAQYAPSPPATQVVNLKKLSITPFFDFRFTDKLAVRFGVPVNAELAARKADGMKGILAKQDRQWSVPAFIATVIKL
jgi:hypothetical protein